MADVCCGDLVYPTKKKKKNYPKNSRLTFFTSKREAESYPVGTDQMLLGTWSSQKELINWEFYRSSEACF